MEPLLKFDKVTAWLGGMPILHGIDFSIGNEALAIVGRNGVGKTTLCKSLFGMVDRVDGSIRFEGSEVAGVQPFEMARLGVALVPQGRRVFPSLSVHEHFTLTAGIRPGAWTVERVYDTFPRLAERRQNRGNQLSGGEQQMLAIGRALLLNPSLLVLDEPSEGLSPLVVQHLQAVLRRLVDEEGMSLLVVEQNFRLAVALSERMLVMVAGEIVLDLPSREFAADAELQERYLGVGH